MDATMSSTGPGLATEELAQKQFVFVGGVHRSGTTVLAEILGEHPAISALTGTGAPHDEGQHLQDVMPTAREHGGPGLFAFDPRARLVEHDAGEPHSARRRLLGAWRPYWDTERPVLLEKSPPNLLRFRYLQAVFPGAAFLAIVRHPIAVAYATQGWAGVPVSRLVEHWMVAHEAFEEDRTHVDRLLVVRYEDLVADTAGTLESITRFLGIASFVPTTDVRTGTNDRYFARHWHSRLLPAHPRVARDALRFQRRLRALPYDYSLWNRRVAVRTAAG
jgi:hypothetical protein